MNQTIDWEKIIKKEARGLDDCDLGEVQEVNEEFVVTQKGRVGKDKFYLPKDKVSRFDGNKVWLTVTREVADIYKHR